MRIDLEPNILMRFAAWTWEKLPNIFAKWGPIAFIFGLILKMFLIFPAMMADIIGSLYQQIQKDYLKARLEKEQP
jgi:hypothetical protein